MPANRFSKPSYPCRIFLLKAVASLGSEETVRTSKIRCDLFSPINLHRTWSAFRGFLGMSHKPLLFYNATSLTYLHPSLCSPSPPAIPQTHPGWPSSGTRGSCPLLRTHPWWPGRKDVPTYSLWPLATWLLRVWMRWESLATFLQTKGGTSSLSTDAASISCSPSPLLKRASSPTDEPKDLWAFPVTLQLTCRCFLPQLECELPKNQEPVALPRSTLKTAFSFLPSKSPSQFVITGSTLTISLL